MRIDIISLFPKMFTGPFAESIIDRAQKNKLVKVVIHDLRNWAIDKRGTVDDKPYGGGVGMVLRPEPIFEAVENIIRASSSNERLVTSNIKRHASRRYTLNTNRLTVLLSASGKPYTQKTALRLSKLKQLILICGHYEGVDQRVADHLVDEEISIGDYVLTGGEIPAMVIVDSVIRLLPGVLTKPEAIKHESFSPSITSLLEHPHYTRPQDFHGFKVPEILLSGHHRDIEKWRERKSLEKTKKLRPDLLKK